MFSTMPWGFFLQLSHFSSQQNQHVSWANVRYKIFNVGSAGKNTYLFIYSVHLIYSVMFDNLFTISRYCFQRKRGREFAICYIFLSNHTWYSRPAYLHTKIIMLIDVDYEGEQTSMSFPNHKCEITRAHITWKPLCYAPDFNWVRL